MSDLTEWIKERRRIHNAATPKAQGRWSYRVDQYDFDAPIMDGKGDYLGCSPDDGVRAGFDTEVAEHIVDAHNTLPALLTAVEKVLELHQRFGLYELDDSCPNMDEEHCEERHRVCADDPGEYFCADMPVEAVCEGCGEIDGERVEWPCPTVRAIEGAINEH